LKVLVNRKQRYAAVSFAVSLVLIAVVAGYAIVRSHLTGNEVIGQTLVDSEFPSPGSLPFFLKPVTWLMILITISWFSFVEVIKDRVRAERGLVRSVISVSFLLVIIMSLYESLYNFMLWGAILANADPETFNPDKVVNPFPSGQYKTNLVFATKLFVTVLGCSVYGFYVLREENGDK
jgi:hypothetical protein